jgi:hypothetical protein
MMPSIRERLPNASAVLPTTGTGGERGAPAIDAPVLTIAAQKNGDDVA